MSEAAHQETYRRLTNLLTDTLRRQLDGGLLLTDTTLKITSHRWLVQQPVSNNPAAINQTLDKLTYLRAMGVAGWDVSSLHPNRQKRLALLARSRSNRHLERLPAYKRYPVLVAFLAKSLLTLTDDALAMFDTYWEQSLAKARRDYEHYQQQTVGRCRRFGKRYYPVHPGPCRRRGTRRRPDPR